MSQFKVGKIYDIRHNRKGRFVAKITKTDDTWTTGNIVEGRTRAMCDYNVVETGEEVTFRNSFCGSGTVEVELTKKDAYTPVEVEE